VVPIGGLVADKPTQDFDFEQDDKETEERLASLEGLLRAHKFEHAQKLRAAQDGEEPPPTSDLERIMKLERQVTNMRAYLRVRRQTRGQ
jgi:hypothetical protein